MNGKRRVLYKTISGTKQDAKRWVTTLQQERFQRGTINGEPVLSTADYGDWLYALRMCIPGYEHCPIKIGLTGNPQKRKATFTGSGPYPIEWIGCWPVMDGRFSEGEFHERFHKHRLCGEWFFPHEDLLAAIQKCVNSQLPIP